MPRGIDSRFNPSRQVGRHAFYTDGVTAGNHVWAEKREDYRQELESMMSEHPYGEPPRPAAKMVDKGMRPGTSQAEIVEGSTRTRVDPSIKKK